MTVVTMSRNLPKPWSDAITCAACDRRLLPLSYTLPLDDDLPGAESRPLLKCPGCAQRYQWQDSAGWVPLVGKGSQLQPS